MTRQKTVYINPVDVERKWHIIDAQDKILGKVAVAAANLVQGKHKPCFTPHQEIGDYVVIINADKVALSGNKAQDKKYFRHSGYPGSLKKKTLQILIKESQAFLLSLQLRECYLRIK